MILTKKQDEAVKLAVQRFHSGESYTCVAGYAGCGKAQPIDTLIPTPNGLKRMGELRVGDFIFDRMGKPTKIKGVFPQGKQDVYTLTLADNRTTECCLDHNWSIIDKHDRQRVLTTKELIEKGLKNSSGFKYAIPNNKPVEYSKKDFSIDPYVIGAFIGDGCCLERQLTFSSENEEIPKIIAGLINAKSYQKNSEFNYNWNFSLPEEKGLKKKFQTKELFKDFINELCCNSHDKRIPECYKYGNIEQRYSLLQGLFDTDGSISSKDQKRYNIRYTSVNLNLIKDIQDVLNSLGYHSTIVVDNKRPKKYRNGICYGLNVNISNEEKHNLFRLKRKKDIALDAKNYKKRKNYNKISIIDIKKEEYQKEMVCFLVDNDEHLYLTNDYIVTHNTTVVAYIVKALNLEPHEVSYIAYTGKAALVLKEKGCPNAQTAHKLLYKAIPKKDGGFIFKKVDLSDSGYKLIVVDEVSMLPKEMWELLLSHKIHVIALGDPAQLPALFKDEDNHVLDAPHIFLDQIMRQALDSEIIKLSMDVRENKTITPIIGQEVQVLPKDKLVSGMFLWADQILCATNRQRIAINQQVRQMLNKDPHMPEEGDKVICLSNYWDMMSKDGVPLVNGTIGTLSNIYKTAVIYPESYGGKIDVIGGKLLLESGDSINIEMDAKLLQEGVPSLTPPQKYKISKSKKYRGTLPLEFDYAYAITYWKAQGSEWDKILLIEEKFPTDKETHLRAMYTAVTRAVKKLVWVRK